MESLRRSTLRHAGGVTELAVGLGPGVVAEVLGDWVAARSVFAVTSEPVWRLHGERCCAPLAAAAASWTVLEVPDGEAAKTPAVAERLWRRLLAAGGRRDSRVVAFGGGSVGDVAGFAAATFLRGVGVCQVPTTVLAQVDAAIGGKSAINLPGAKNSVGVFRQPDRVVAAVELLATLDERERRAGLVEVVKMAALLDPGLLDRVERDLDLLLVAVGEPWVDLVARAQAAKVGVVERDPLESGERRVLNFGHTLGHALEAHAGFGALLHGEAVAYGMLFALQLAGGRGLDTGFRRRLETVIERLEPAALPPASVDELLTLAGRDKKAGREGIVWVLPTAPGAWEAVTLESGVLRAELEAFMARHCKAC
jgi:3-dehydroquinate synthase